MPVDRNNWTELFERNRFPSFPCPHCDRGRVILDKETLKVEEPQFSVDAHQHEDWDPSWDLERFSLYLRCSESSCGEIVIVSGETTITDTYDDEYGWGVSSALKPQAFFPAPPIIKIPRDTSRNVRMRIETAFALFWMDVGASANSLRASVEILLDDLNVPKTTISKKTGETVDLDLNGRIQFYEKNAPDHGETFHALRMVGNLGSHGMSLTREAILDAFEIYEDALDEIVGSRKAYLASIKKKIIDNKGKY